MSPADQVRLKSHEVTPWDVLKIERLETGPYSGYGVELVENPITSSGVP